MEATGATEGQGRHGQIQAHTNVNMGVYERAQVQASMHDGVCRHTWTTMARTDERGRGRAWTIETSPASFCYPKPQVSELLRIS